MSTIENLESTGRPFDVLKSFCHPAVFNTAIARSKSLVVAVGNPLLLMLSESTINKPKWCWREYISRCLNNKTYYGEVTVQLKEMLGCHEPDSKFMFLFFKPSYF